MPKLDLQPPMPPLFPPLFFAKIFNYVLKNMQKLDLQNCPASLPCQQFLNTSFSQRYIITCLKTYQNSTFKTGLPAPHASTFSTRLFRKDIQLRDKKCQNSTSKTYQPPPHASTFSLIFNTSFSQRYSITCSKACQNSTSKTGQPAPHASTF